MKSSTFNNRNLLHRQPIQLVHQIIDRRIRRLNLPGQQRLLMLQLRVLQPLIQVEHLRDERNHAIMAGIVCWVGEAHTRLQHPGPLVLCAENYNSENLSPGSFHDHIYRILPSRILQTRTNTFESEVISASECR